MEDIDGAASSKRVDAEEDVSPAVSKKITCQDLPKWLWLYLPLIYYAVRYIAFYGAHMGILPNLKWLVQGETGIIESISVLSLFMASVYAVVLVCKFYRRLSIFMRCMFLCYALGCFFVGGEEASWGQHYFKWQTPASFDNVQNETNFHNSEIAMSTFNRLRLLVGHVIVVCGAICPIVLLLLRRFPHPTTNRWWWLFPTQVCIPTALLIALSTLPSDLNKIFGSSIPAPTGLGEFKECYIYLFLLMFILSAYYRMKWMSKNGYIWRNV